MADNSGGSLKIILGFILALTLQLGVLAAGPAVPYSAFNANDFKIINGQIFLRVHVVGGTNLYVTNLYSQTIVTTNFYVTNFISGDTIVTINTNIYLTNTYLFLNGSNVASVNPTDNYLPKRQSATNFVDSTISDDGTWTTVHGTGTSTLELETDDGQVVFGGGGTNVLERNGSDLLATNGAVITRFGVKSPSGTAYIGMNSGSAQVTGGTALQLLNKNGNGLFLSDAVVSPSGDGTISLGGPSSSTWFYDLGLTHGLYVSGYRNGSNHSWLEISHGGTNDGIHLVSQSAGTAGPPRPFYVDGAQMRVNYNSTTDNNLYVYAGNGLGSTSMRGQLLTVELSSSSTLNENEPLGVEGLQMINNKYATASVQQNSPAIMYYSNGWSTNASQSQLVIFDTYSHPSSGGDYPSGLLVTKAYVSNNIPTTVFGIASSSGWSGNGTKPFMDNGKFGGGVTTNISGGGLTFTIVNGLITAVTAP